MLKFFAGTSETTDLCISAPGLIPLLLNICHLKAPRQAEDRWVGDQPAKLSSHLVPTEKSDGEGWSAARLISHKQTHTRSYQRQHATPLSGLTEEAFLFCLSMAAATLKAAVKKDLMAVSL